MKNWCKIIEIGEYDILIQRLCNDVDGEHVKITLRVPEGQMMKTLSFGDEEDAESKADKGYKLYGKKEATKFVKAFEEMYNANGEKEDDKKEG